MPEFNAAEKLRSRRPMPDLTKQRLAPEGQAAVIIGRTPKARSETRPEIINTSLTTRHYHMLEDLTANLRRSRGRRWRLNDTIELALDTLARNLTQD